MSRWPALVVVCLLAFTSSATGASARHDPQPRGAPRIFTCDDYLSDDPYVSQASQSSGPAFRRYMRRERTYESVLVRGTGRGKRTYQRFYRGLRSAQERYRVRHHCLGENPRPAWVILPEPPSPEIRRELRTLPFDTRVGYGRQFSQRRLDDVFHRLGRQMDRLDPRWSGCGSASEAGTRYVFGASIDDKPLTHSQVLRIVRRAAATYDHGKFPLPVDIVFCAAGND